MMSEKVFKKFNAHILVVDDYDINLELTKEMLEMLNCKVDTAENGKTALLLLEQNSYDCIFMDIQMPELDGFQLTREIRLKEREDQHVFIFALTANALQGDEEKCLQAGMDAYISKPIKIKDLENILSKYLI